MSIDSDVDTSIRRLFYLAQLHVVLWSFPAQDLARNEMFAVTTKSRFALALRPLAGMESLLASPSQFSPPPSPPDFCSPPLPSLASPFQDSPPPPWMTDDLSQEWVDTTVAGADEESWYATPRADSARTMNYDFGTDDAFGGTFVCREDVKDGLEESQLQAAVRALKGPSSGLGGIEAAEEDATELLAASDASASKQGNPDRLGGLLRLFDPLPPGTSHLLSCPADNAQHPSLYSRRLSRPPRSRHSTSPPRSSPARRGRRCPISRPRTL